MVSSVMSSADEKFNTCVRCKEYNLNLPPTQESYECVKLNVIPKLDICIHKLSVDIHVSRFIKERGLWDAFIVKEIQVMLFGDKELGLIDIGSNIGQFSLIAASMNRSVLAVEPFVENIKRFHKSVHLNKFNGRIKLLHNAVSDRRGRVSLRPNKDNQGGITLQRNVSCDANGACPPAVNTILMDDLLRVLPFKKAVVKIDIEGHEHRAFKHATRFLQTLNVPFIVMEWLLCRAYYGSDAHSSEDKDLVQNMLDQFQHFGYSAYSLVIGKRLKNEFWYAWPDDIIWKHYSVE